MNILDQLAFGPGRELKAWIMGALLTLTLIAVLAAALYLSVSSDYSYLKASLYTGLPRGQYATVGKRLEDLARSMGGDLTAVETMGAVENITRLTGENGTCKPGFALVQDGLPVSADSGIEVLGRLPQPESLLILGRRGRTISGFGDLSHATIGVGPVGSGTDYLVRQILSNPDMKTLDLRPANYGYEEQADLVAHGHIDLAAVVMNQNSELMRDLMVTRDLEIVSPADIEGLIARLGWLRLGRIPAGFYDVTKPIPQDDKLVAQVDTLIMANACAHRAERVALLMLLTKEFPSFIRINPPPSAKSQDMAPLADEARKYFAVGEPEFADKYLPWFVNIMSPAYWLYLLMAVTILLNAADTYSRFRLWRIDANRERLESRLRAFVNASRPGPAAAHPESGASRGRGPDRQAAAALLAEFEALHERCRQQLRSFFTPMGSEMYYRYQEALIVEAEQALGRLLAGGD